MSLVFELIVAGMMNTKVIEGDVAYSWQRNCYQPGYYYNYVVAKQNVKGISILRGMFCG